MRFTLAVVAAMASSALAQGGRSPTNSAEINAARASASITHTGSTTHSGTAKASGTGVVPVGVPAQFQGAAANVAGPLAGVLGGAAVIAYNLL